MRARRPSQWLVVEAPVSPPPMRSDRPTNASARKAVAYALVGLFLIVTGFLAVRHGVAAHTQISRTLERGAALANWAIALGVLEIGAFLYVLLRLVEG